MLAFFCLVILWFCPWRFQVNDDQIMMWLVSGAYTGEPEWYAVFIHPFLSWVFAKFYTFFPNIPWYPLTWYLAVFLSFFLIHFKVAKSRLGLSQQIFFRVFALILCLHFGIFPQFTLIAGFLAFAGLLVLWSDENQIHRPMKMLAWMAVILSILIRAEAFVLIGLGLGFYGAVFSSLLQKKWKILTTILLLFVGLYVIKNFVEYNSEYAEYTTYNKARHSVIDHPVFYEMKQDSLFDSNSEWFFFSNSLSQEGSVTVKLLDDFKIKLDQSYFEFDYFKKSILRLWRIQATELFKGFLSLTLILFFIIYYRKDKKKLLFLGLWLLFLLICNHFLIIRGRVTLLFYLVLLYPVITAKKHDLPKGIFGIVSTTLVVFFLLHFYNFLREADRRQYFESEFNYFLERIDPNHLTLVDGVPLEYFPKSFDIGNQTPFMIQGWLSRSPFQQKFLNKYGLQKLSETRNFNLIGGSEYRPFYMQDFMNSIGGNYKLIRTEENSVVVWELYQK